MLVFSKLRQDQLAPSVNQKNIYSADLFFVQFAGDERGQDVCGWTRKISPKLKPSVCLFLLTTYALFCW